MDNNRGTTERSWMKIRSRHGDAVMHEVIMNDYTKVEDQSLVCFGDYLNTKPIDLASGSAFVINQKPWTPGVGGSNGLSSPMKNLIYRFRVSYKHCIRAILI